MPKSCRDDEEESKFLNRKVYSWIWQAVNGNVNAVFRSLECRLFKAQQQNNSLNIYRPPQQVRATSILCAFLESHGSNIQNHSWLYLHAVFLAKMIGQDKIGFKQCLEELSAFSHYIQHKQDILNYIALV